MKSLLILLIAQSLFASSVQTQCDIKIYEAMSTAEQSIGDMYVNCTELNRSINTFTIIQLSCKSADIQDVLPTLKQVYKQQCK